MALNRAVQDRGWSTCHDALKGCYRIRHSVFRAHRFAQRPGPGSYRGGGGEVERPGECLSFGPQSIHRGGGDAGQAQALGPEELVCREWDYDGRHARACSGVRGAGATVMDDRGGPWEEPIVRGVVDCEKV